MNGNIEELVLSGKLFNPPSRSSSPTRSRSPSPSSTPAAWPTDGGDYDYDSDAERRRALETRLSAQTKEPDSIGMGPGRTGVKGVIRDHAEAASAARARRAQEIAELNRAMEKASLGGKTWAEEERERLAERARLEGSPDPRNGGRGQKGRFGHLREVGVRSFVQAVEEDRSVFVLVHIYDPSLDRCATLDDTLSRLARLYPSTKFLRARAGALGFASTATASAPIRLGARAPFTLRHSASLQMIVPGQRDEDDPFGLDDNSDEDEDDVQSGRDGWDDDAVDTDVLPTLLAYRGGQLEHAWVRVDWDAKEGTEEFLKRHNVLSDADLSVNSRRLQDKLSDDDDLDEGELLFSGSEADYA